MNAKLLTALGLLAVAPGQARNASAQSEPTQSEPAQQRPKATSVCADDAGWDDPAEPFHIHGNTWFVGTCGITAILVTSPQGHVLIDGAASQGSALISANVAKLGFRMADVRAMLLSHAHMDHAGGFAGLQRLTTAPVWSRGSDAKALQRGRGGADDPQVNSAPPFAPVANVRTLRDGAAVRVGPVTVRAVATPGHTPGGTSWTWRSCEGQSCIAITYVDSLSAISDEGFRFSASPARVAQFQATIARVAALPCDLLLTPHPGASGMWERLGPAAREPAINPGACQALSAGARERLADRLAREAR